MGRPAGWMKALTGRDLMKSPGAPSHRREIERRFWAVVKTIEDRLDAADLDLNAKDALRALEGIQHVTINLGTTSIDRTSTPNAEQASILAALKAEAAPNLRA